MDCGTPTAVTDLVILEVDHHSSSAVYLFFLTSSLSSSSLPSLTKSSKSTSVPIKYSLFFDWPLHCCHCHPQFHHYCLHCHLIKSLKPDLASPLHCQLCASLCRRAVTSPCCGGSACRWGSWEHLCRPTSCTSCDLRIRKWTLICSMIVFSKKEERWYKPISGRVPSSTSQPLAPVGGKTVTGKRWAIGDYQPGVNIFGDYQLGVNICPKQLETVYRPIWDILKLSGVLNQKILKTIFSGQTNGFLFTPVINKKANNSWRQLVWLNFWIRILTAKMLGMNAWMNASYGRPVNANQGFTSLTTEGHWEDQDPMLTSCSSYLPADHTVITGNLERGEVLD